MLRPCRAWLSATPQLPQVMFNYALFASDWQNKPIHTAVYAADGNGAVHGFASIHSKLSAVDMKALPCRRSCGTPAPAERQGSVHAARRCTPRAPYVRLFSGLRRSTAREYLVLLADDQMPDRTAGGSSMARAILRASPELIPEEGSPPGSDIA